MIRKCEKGNCPKCYWSETGKETTASPRSQVQMFWGWSSEHTGETGMRSLRASPAAGSPSSDPTNGFTQLPDLTEKPEAHI